MQTLHHVVYADARKMPGVGDESVELIVTSPPYPMIEMWDAAFTAMNPAIAAMLKAKAGSQAFELMHQELDKVWCECVRVLKPGGIICINIGDAVRTLSDDFQMYSNHARIIHAFYQLGLTQLPDILWRKPTNAPNKFMGSGMLPVGAYVTYEHEYILLFRKGSRRTFKSAEEKQKRRASAFFWEERNCWFSDLWTDVKGTAQELVDPLTRQRSAAYPFELAYRLICMHSIYEDTVLDPFLGTGTTMAAAIAGGRNSVGIESDVQLQTAISRSAENAITLGAKQIAMRLCNHQEFILLRAEASLKCKYRNSHYGFPVMTSYETDIELPMPQRLTSLNGRYKVKYEVVAKRAISKTR
ncbi:MAG: site-specific DNA-methyltransferase [Abitibacteriaceae bacterium]|nr:site-specific DNA-methyltransferase [Abditibacteriaceae bacterium]